MNYNEDAVPVEWDYDSIDINKFKKNGKWNIVGALDCVLQLTENSEFCEKFWKIVSNPLKFLRKKLGLTDIQIIVIAIMIESGKSVSWRTLGNYIGISRLKMMTYSEEIEELLKKGWIQRAASNESGSVYQGFRLIYGVVSALRLNKTFIPEKLDGLTLQQFVDRLEFFIDNHLKTKNYSNTDIIEWVDLFIEKNPDLLLCKVLKRLNDKNEKLTLIMILIDYSHYADSEGEGLYFQTVNNVIGEDMETILFLDELKEGNLSIFEDGLVDFECNDGIANNERYLLTNYMKNEILKSYIPRRSKVRKTLREYEGFLKKNNSIKEKELFYNQEEEVQIKKLTTLLNEEKFTGIQKRLEDEGMRKGFACIFYGAPRTGKTETVLQIARQTGRDIMQIDIAGMRDKWVGETEKNIQGVFNSYKELCDNTKIKPILFFNEADALFGKRMEQAEHSVDKMNNAMQNIILQEMENLEGILIATTNLTGSLDKAFERRFLFKIEFKKPVFEVKAKIWNSMFKGRLNDDDIMKLAKEYDFAGGEIENIARKRTIDFILEGEELKFEKLCQYCEEERLKNRFQRTVGFNKFNKNLYEETFNRIFLKPVLLNDLPF